MQGRTTLIIPHRLAIVQKADKIVVMENGQIVETGDATELGKKKGLVRKPGGIAI
jgi:ATP-binding cassette subfamily B protein